MNASLRLLALLAILAACGPPTASPATAAAATSTPTPRATTTAPFGSAGATPRDLADALAKAFAAKDADAVGRLLATPSIGSSAIVEPVQPGDPDRGNCCVLNIPVVSFVNELRAKFASGALAVTVVPQVQPTPANAAAEPFFVTSDWIEADRTTKIDLYLRDMGNGWVWAGALHHYPRAAAKGVCIVDYRPPWVPTGTTTHGC